MMKKYFCLWFAMFFLICAQVAYAGTIIVNHDEWTLSNRGFSSGDAAQFAINVGNFFTDGQPGNFLVYSANFGLTQSSLATTMTDAGHTWNVNTSEDTSLGNLLQYDGIFLAGTAMDNALITDYVNSGGNVYLAGGTTSTVGWTANQWNGFLNNFGMEYATGLNGVGGRATTSDHPLFDNVDALYYLNGNYVNLLDPANPDAVILESVGSNGLIAVYDPVPVPAAVWMLGSGIGVLISLRRKLR